MSDPAAKSFSVPIPDVSVASPSSAPNNSSPRERRRRQRVHLEMLVRIRWLGPFGLETEITQTLNVSRDGLLVSSANLRQTGTLLWATFPYDAAVAFSESETQGRVARCAVASAPDNATDIASRNTIAIAFHHHDLNPMVAALTKNNLSIRAGRIERRRHARIPIAFLIRIDRRDHVTQNLQSPHESPPWPEETMTVDVSPAGMLFCTLQIYELGEQLAISAQVGRKLSTERRARIVRVNTPPGRFSVVACGG
jgi:hypothetical protein